MITNIARYVNYFYLRHQTKFPDIDQSIIKSALVYQYLFNKHFHKNISIEEILELNNYDIGLIGPDHGRITKFLERLFRNSDVMHNHSILHDAFGRFYDNYGKGRGYTYAFEKTPNCLKRSPLGGQISGIIYCSIKKPNLYK